ncbi:MAG: AzlD domain-containing protein [Desulfovibrionaceae bacterium]|nr:AzlD domain-containing protein [Desulfovibrionaceae bacterium]
MTTDLMLCLAGCLIATVLPKILPLTFLNGEHLPPLFKKWLDCIPVAVMAALVGSEVFFYNNTFNVSPTNLYLTVSIPLVFLAWYTKSYFITIAVGLGLVIAARAFGLAA